MQPHPSFFSEKSDNAQRKRYSIGLLGVFHSEMENSVVPVKIFILMQFCNEQHQSLRNSGK